MFDRELKSKLPELRQGSSILNENVRDRDWSQKLTQKVYADERRGATGSPVVPGSQILLKNTKSTGKLAANFEKEPYTVVTKEGREVIVKSNEGVLYRRNSSFVKPFNQPSSVDSDAKIGDDQVCMDLGSETPETVVGSSRPKRTVKLPDKFQDFVLSKPK